MYQIFFLNKLFSLKGFYLVAGVGTLGVLLWTGYILYWGGDGPPDPTWERIQREKVLVVAVDPSYPPFASYGEPLPSGLDVEVALALANVLGVEVRFSGQGFDALYDALALGHVDMIVSALQYDPLRTEQVYYTRPYADAGEVFVVLQSVTAYPINFDKIAGQRLAVLFASEGDLAAQRYLVEHPQTFEMLWVDTADDIAQVLATGQADVALLDRISAGELARADLGRYWLSPPVIPQPFVIALRRADWRLALEIENALAQLQATGVLDKLIDKWIAPQAD
jgi:polar amino acid transport system substrate-binding protein